LWNENLVKSILSLIFGPNIAETIIATSLLAIPKYSNTNIYHTEFVKESFLQNIKYDFHYFGVFFHNALYGKLIGNVNEFFFLPHESTIKLYFIVRLFELLLFGQVNLFDVVSNTTQIRKDFKYFYDSIEKLISIPGFLGKFN
jgi:hypothetical protein